jgi:predicted flap endonuclease-1-like 5' DNA nuclease
MTRVVREPVAVTRVEVEDLAQRLLALRGEIDGMLAAIGRRPSHASMSREPSGPKSAPVADDLALIRGIDAALGDQIRSLGFDTFAQIARWSKRDVIYVSEALGLDRRISRENWIEQAAILAPGGMTAFAGGRSKCPWSTDWSAAIVAPRPNQPGADTQVAAGKRPSVWALQSACAKDTSPVAVPSLHPFRGIPSVAHAIFETPPPASRGRVALAAKLAVWLISLLVAAVLMVDRNAWGSGQPSVTPLSIRPVPAFERSTVTSSPGAF